MSRNHGNHVPPLVMDRIYEYISRMHTDLVIEDVRLTPILVADPPLLNTQGVHQPYTPGSSWKWSPGAG